MRLRPFAPPPASAARAWAARPATFRPGDAARNVDRDEVEARPRDPDAAFARARDALLAYDVYPEGVLWHRFAPPLAPGTVLVQRIRVGPLALEAGVRVTDAWDAPGRVGYRYVTLQGHPERGEASFHLEREGDRVAFRIESASELARPYAPWLRAYARRRQRAAVAGALARMRGRLLA